MATEVPSTATPAPIARRMSAVISTSPPRGALSSHVGESPRRAATINFVTTFFDPATSISPLRGPFGSMAQARVTFTAPIVARPTADRVPPPGAADRSKRRPPAPLHLLTLEHP